MRPTFRFWPMNSARTKETGPESGALGSEIMAIHEVADYLKLHVGTVYRFIKTRGIPAFRLGSDFRVRRGDLENWVAQQQVPAGESKLTGKGHYKRES